MRVPSDLSGQELIKILKKKFDYEITRQNGSHIRISTMKNGQHHITIPNHNPIKIGTLNGIFGDISDHFKINKIELVNLLFQ